MTAAYREGYEAFREGVRWIENPYPAESAQEDDWALGWNAARLDSYMNEPGQISMADELAGR